MDVGERRWPLVEGLLDSHGLAGVAVAVVHEDQTVARGFGVRDLGTRAPVTPETMFHLASVSKPFVATAVVSLATFPDAGDPALDLDAPITDWLPELTLADGRQGEVTARGLLSHTSGLPDVVDYGWHDPQLGDDALSSFAGSLSDWRLKFEPGSEFSYSNAGYELLGLLVSRVTGTTFEDAMRDRLLVPLGMADSTFLRADVPAHLASSPHVGMPLSVPEGAYPYTRRHAPSSSLHSNLVDLCRWMVAHLEPAEPVAGLRDLMWRPVIEMDEPPSGETMALGWAGGSYLGHRTVSHSGADPGFGSKLALVPERRTGVVVLANSNTVPTGTIARAALDIVLAGPEDPREGVAELSALRPPGVCPVAETLAASGSEAAAELFHRLTAVDPPELDLDDDGFEDAVWGAIELHRTAMVWPLLRLWTSVRPDSSNAWTMSGWAHHIDGDPDLARPLLQRALELDPENEDAALIMSGLPSA